MNVASVKQVRYIVCILAFLNLVTADPPSPPPLPLPPLSSPSIPTPFLYLLLLLFTIFESAKEIGYFLFRVLRNTVWDHIFRELFKSPTVFMNAMFAVPINGCMIIFAFDM